MNTLVSFGPYVRNQHRMEVTPFITPPETCLRPLVFVPSDDGEILSFELHTGGMVQRWRGMEGQKPGRVTCITGRRGYQVSSHPFRC
jgi:hypothetical protein